MAEIYIDHYIVKCKGLLPLMQRKLIQCNALLWIHVRQVSEIIVRGVNGVRGGVDTYASVASCA